MRLIGNGLVLRPPKPSRTTSGKVSFVCLLQLPGRTGSLTLSRSRQNCWCHTWQSYRYLQQLPRLHRECPLPDCRISSLSPLIIQIDWQPDTLTWLIDGNPVRTLKKSDTVNSNGVATYPTTPARIQFRWNSLLLLSLGTKLTSPPRTSMWPAGLPGTSDGIVQWAGGMINWNDPDYVAAGHFYTLIKAVNVTCNDPVKPSVDVTSYVYNPNTSTFTPGVAFSNKTTVNGAVGGHVTNPLLILGATAAGVFLSQFF